KADEEISLPPPELPIAAMTPSWRFSAARRGDPRFQDVALQTFAAVPEHRAEICLCNRTAHPERQAGLGRHAVSEPRLARRNLLQEVVLRKRMEERHGMPGQIERASAILLPAEEALVGGDAPQPNRPGRSDPVGLIAGPNYLVYSVKPSGPGFSVLENRKDIGRPAATPTMFLKRMGAVSKNESSTGWQGKRMARSSHSRGGDELAAY